MSAVGEESAPSPLALLRRLEWRVRHAAENILGGEYRSAFRGRGMEFDQVVKYEYGDDVRDIDWNVTARLGEPYRKKFVEEREITVVVVFEDSPTLGFGSGARTKRDALLELAGLVGLLNALSRDRFGVLHARPEGFRFRPPVRGRGPILHASASLIAEPPPELDAPRPVVPWRFLFKAVPRHSIVLWLGDFPPGPEPEGWATLKRRFEVVGFRIDDPWDRALPADAAFAAFDPAAGRLVPIDGSSAVQRRAHARWRETRERAWVERFPDPLARLVVGADESLLDGLVAFFRARMRGIGAAGR